MSARQTGAKNSFMHILFFTGQKENIKGWALE
jgi:hypothetical protein